MTIFSIYGSIPGNNLSTDPYVIRKTHTLYGNHMALSSSFFSSLTLWLILLHILLCFCRLLWSVCVKAITSVWQRHTLFLHLGLFETIVFAPLRVVKQLLLLTGRSRAVSLGVCSPDFPQIIFLAFVWGSSCHRKQCECVSKFRPGISFVLSNT